MPERLSRDALALSKKEVTYGTDSVPTGAANALLLSAFTVDPLNTENVKRDLFRQFLGGAEELVGDRHIGAQYSVELVGSGAAGTAPPWGPQMLAIGFAETLTGGTRTDYTLVSPAGGAFDSLSNYYHDSGVKHISLGTRGNGIFRLEQGERPLLDLSMLGIHNAETAVAQPTPTLTAWKQPEAIINANSGDVTLGCTHSAVGAPALTGGTLYPSKGLRIDLGNTVAYSALLGDEAVIIAQREVKGSMTLKVTAAQEVSLMAMVRANTLTSIGLSHGTVANNKLLVFMGFCQLLNPKKGEEKGQRLLTLDFRATPSVGNDELRVVTSF